MEIKLELGCQEFCDESGFVFSKDISNIILDTKNIKDSVKKNKIENFLTESCDLNKRPCYDFNKVANIVKYLYNKDNIINEDMLHKIQLFFHLYRKFGVYLKLVG